MIDYIDHINIVVSDLAEGTRFFETLGFRKTEGSMLQGDWISAVIGLSDVRAEYVSLSLPSGGTVLELIRYFSPLPLPGPSEEPNRIGIRHIALKVKGIESVVERLESSGIEFISRGIQVFPKNGKKLIYLRGPDNIILELAEYL